MKILVTPTSLQPGKNTEALSVLENFSGELVFNPTGRPLTPSELIPLLEDCEGYIAGLDMITREVIESSPKLKVISRYGAGVDRVDLAAAREKGVIVTNTPSANAQAVGELAFCLALCIARKVPYLNEQTREGKWIRSTGVELFGKTIGIVGLGAVGKVVARCAQGFGMTVLAYDPYINEEYCTAQGICMADFDRLIQKSDVISLHLPLTEHTRHIINAESISRLKKTAIIVNTSRGGIIDEKAAYEALIAGELGGLGLDAFESEPPEKSPLFELSNVVVTPHTGAHTKEATEKMAEVSVRNLIDILTGRDCPYIVNR